MLPPLPWISSLTGGALANEPQTQLPLDPVVVLAFPGDSDPARAARLGQLISADGPLNGNLTERYSSLLFRHATRGPRAAAGARR